MRTVINSHRDILLDVQGSNVWSGQQVQSYNSDAIAWGALGKPLYATGTRYGVRSCFNYPECFPFSREHFTVLMKNNLVCTIYAPRRTGIPDHSLASASAVPQVWVESRLHSRPRW